MEDQATNILQAEAQSLYNAEIDSEEQEVNLKNELERATTRMKEMEQMVKQLESENEKRTRNLELSRNYRAMMSSQMQEIHNLFEVVSPEFQQCESQLNKSKEFTNMFMEQQKHNDSELKNFDRLLKKKLKERTALLEQMKLDMNKEEEANKENLKILDDKIESVTLKNNQLKGKMEVMGKKIEDLQKDVKEDTSKENELNVQNSDIKMAIEEKEFKKEEIRLELNNFENIFESESKNLIAINEETQKRISEEESAIKKYQLELEEKTSENMMLEEKTVEFDKSNQELQIKITHVEKELQAIKQKNITDEETFNKEFSALSKKLEEQNTLVNEEQRKLYENEKMLKTLKDEEELKLLEQQNATDDYEEANIKKLKISSDAKLLEAKIKTLTNTIEELSRNTAENEDKISQLDKKISEDSELFQSEEGKQKLSEEELQTESETMQRDLEKFEEESEKERRVLEENLTKEVNSLKQRVAELKLERENLKEIRKSKETKLQGVQLEGNVLSRKVQALQEKEAMEKRKLAKAAKENRKRKENEASTSKNPPSILELMRAKKGNRA